jgi:peptide/nickel transport system substrate-binding protein
VKVHSRRGRAIALGLIAALLLAACSGGTRARRNSQSQAVPQTFTYATFSQVMTGWDPASSYSNEIIGMSNMYETLTHYNSATKKADPSLAESWTSTPDGKTWTFKLRSGVTFHTGRPMDAAAAKAAIDRTIKLKQGAAYIWDSVKSIDAPDPQTLVFHLKYPAPMDLNASADYAAYIYDTRAAGTADLAKWFEQGHDAGTGPYTVKSWHSGQEIELTLTSYPKYWRGWSGAHYKNVVFRVVSQPTTSAQLLRAGQVSFVEQLTPQLLATFKNDPKFKVVESPSWQNLLGMLNAKSGPLANPAVRQAISYAVDYDGIINVLKGAGVPSSGVVPPGLWGHFDDLPSYRHDQTKAAALLKQAGYGPGGKPIRLKLTYTQGDAAEPLVASLIRSNLAPLNVTVESQGLQWETQWAKAKSADPSKRQDILLFYWWPDYADPYSWFINLFHSEEQPNYNLSYYSNSKLDVMMTKAEQDAATNRDQAVQAYRDMQVMLLRDAPALFLYNQNYQYAMLNSVGNLQVNPAYPNVVFAYDLQPLAR